MRRTCVRRDRIVEDGKGGILGPECMDPECIDWVQAPEMLPFEMDKGV
jgi:hypothetical protein